MGLASVNIGTASLVGDKAVEFMNQHLASLREKADADASDELVDRKITIPADVEDRLEGIQQAALTITNGALQGIYSLKNLRSFTIEFVEPEYPAE